jgi:DNA-binding PadR family transcriptional regulator
MAGRLSSELAVERLRNSQVRSGRDSATTRTKLSNPLGLAVLSLLAERPMHPYDLAVTLRKRAKESSIKLNCGSLYSVIGALEAAGFICAREKTRMGARPERTVYALTKSGEVELHEWLGELLSVPMKEYSKFEAGLSLTPVLRPAEVAELLAQRQQRLSAEARRLRAELEADGDRRSLVIEKDYQLAMRLAERDWVVALQRRITESVAFTKPWRAWRIDMMRRDPTKRRGGSRKAH